jgi:acetyl esterase/lipase
LALISAWTDLTQSGASYETNAANDPFFQKQTVDGLAGMFRGNADPLDPTLDVLRQDFRGFPPIYVQVGGDETLLDDSRQLAENATAAGVEVVLDEYEGQLHTFQMAAGQLADADKALANLAMWIRAKLGVTALVG